MFDLVIRGGTVATETGSECADVGISGGVITACGRRLGPGAREIGATGRLVLPGGVDAHCHVDQKSSSGLMTADDFFTAGVSAACGGTTTIIPFAAQHRGQSLRAVEFSSGQRLLADFQVVQHDIKKLTNDPDHCCFLYPYRRPHPALLPNGKRFAYRLKWLKTWPTMVHGNMRLSDLRFVGVMQRRQHLL